MLDAWLPVLDAVDDATSVASITVTTPGTVGVRLNVYVVPLPETALTVALVAVTLVLANPFTLSENVAVIGINVAFVVLALVDDRTTVGPPDAADDNDANPPSTISALHNTAAETERRPIDFDFIILLKCLELIIYS